MTSTGTSFNPPQLLLDVPFYGTRGTISGTGSSGVTRIEAINDASTWRIGIVVHSQAPVLDSSVPFFGNRATLLGDVTGDGYMDLIAVNTDSTWVMASPEGSQFPFEPPQLTSTVSFYGTSATLAGDVDGDGKADLIAVNDSSIWVMTADGSGFGPPSLTSSGPFYGDVETLSADVNGDGKADVVAINGGSIWVETSNGSGFGPPTLWADSS